jgi:hypothetical protein
MRALIQEKERALQMRRNGMSYRDILKEIDVAKSSLSLWLKDLPLTEDEKKALKKRRNNNITHGRIKAAGELRKRRLDRESVWLNEARAEFQEHKGSQLFPVGVALYWAEGAKRTNQWSFINSDEDMLVVMLDWLETYTEYTRASVRVRVYMHKLYAHENCEEWWHKKLQVPLSQFSKTVYKPSGKGVKKRPQYKGCLRIEAPRSKELLVKMKFWQNMLIEHCSK